VSALEQRVKRLEQVGGDGECPRCSGTTVIFVNDELSSVNRDGIQFTDEDARTFVEEGGECPLCGRGREEITVGGWERQRRSSQSNGD
jgi:hypothetical protein